MFSESMADLQSFLILCEQVVKSSEDAGGTALNTG